MAEKINKNSPNIMHIDAVMASVKAHPLEWEAALGSVRKDIWVVTWDLVWYNAWLLAWEKSVGEGRRAEWIKLMATARSEVPTTLARSAARCAISALIAYDDCAHMLYSEPSDLRIMSKLGSNEATLMIPASVAFKLIRESAIPVL